MFFRVTQITFTKLVIVCVYPFISIFFWCLQVGVYLNGQSSTPGYMATYFHLTSGPNDHNLKWPCPWQQATMALMDQQSDVRQQMNMHRMVTTDPNKMSSDGMRALTVGACWRRFQEAAVPISVLLVSGTEFYWDDPRKVGSEVTGSDGSSYYRGPGYGTSTFISHSGLRSRSFIKGDDAFFLLSLEGGRSFWGWWSNMGKYIKQYIPLYEI